MTAPRVSICIPAFKAEAFLAETLASVRAQTFVDWELIVVEDGSRDGTEAIVRAFAAAGPQPVRYARHDANRGLPATRNTAAGLATGAWLAILDSDDLWTPDHLARSLAVAPASGPALVFGGSIVFDSATGAELYRRVPPAQQADLLGALFDARLIIQPAAVLLDRPAVARVGDFDSRFPICNDLDYWLRCAAAGVTFHYNGACTLRYRKHPGAMSAKSAAMFAESGRVYLASAGGFPGRSPAAARRLARKRFLSAARILRGSDLPGAVRLAAITARTFLPF